LLLYLARAPAHRCTRDHAIGLLWPEKDQALARQSLREAVRTLRRYIGEDHLHTPADQLELIAGAVELDTDRFDACVAAGDWAGATPLVTGKFAEGFVLPDASTFEDWLHAERWHWHGRMMDALIQHAEQRIAAGDLRGADEPARRAHQLDPLSDRALRTLMRRLALAIARRRWRCTPRRSNASHASTPRRSTRRPRPSPSVSGAGANGSCRPTRWPPSRA
jgi:DNA-binding SARP family transcriptional activator